MGSWGSREVATQTHDFALPVTKLFVNFQCFGFILGLLIYEHDVYENVNFLSAPFNIIRLLKFTYFFWFVLTLFVVYIGIYLLVLEKVARPFIVALVGSRRELQCENLIETIFGIWSCGQILGFWIDCEAHSSCMRFHNCRGYFLQNLVLMMESVCEYFLAYEYDPARDAYFLTNKNNVCYGLFHTAPLFLLTILSTGLSYVVINAL